MRILLVGEHQEERNKFKNLLDLAFPNSKILCQQPHSLYSQLKTDWSIVIILHHPTIVYDDLLALYVNASIPVLCIVNKKEKQDYLDLLRKGVKAIIGYDASFETLRNSVYFSLEGGVYFEPSIAKEIDLLSELNKNHSPDIPNFTQKQWAIYKMIAKGMTNDEIAKKLNISSANVLIHQKNIISSTQSKTIAGAVAKGFYYGWLKNI